MLNSAVTCESLPPTGEGAGRNTRGRVCSPKWDVTANTRVWLSLKLRVHSDGSWTGWKRCPTIWLAFILFAFGLNAPAADSVDLSKLPPAADHEVSFIKDVRPILEANCFRCHGDERQKSGFSLTTRERALKGGDEGVDIIPGDSANSPLIHYVSHLVEDMEMPPPGRNEPLSKAEVGILRAWIDQGARYEEEATFDTSGVLTPAMQWIGVSGDSGSFRQIEGIRDKWSGGLEEFSFEGKSGSGSKVEVEGHVLAPDDYRVSLTLTHHQVGFIRTGAEKWRRYYDDTGGYNPLVMPSTFDLGQDMGLDIGRAWFDAGLTLPQLPRVVIGYEYQFRQGDKSTLQWGLAGGRAVYPASKSVDENVHIFKVDITYDVAGWALADNARVQWYRNETVRNNTLNADAGQRVVIQQEDRHVQGVNTVRVEKQLTDWWLFSGAYFYSRLDGDSSYAQSTVDASGAPTIGSFWTAPRIELNSESHVFSLASSWTPLRTVSLSLGVQNEYTRQDGFGPVNLDQGDPNNPFLLPVTVDANLDRRRWSELGALRFTGVPYTVLFADARLDQENANQYEQELGNFPAPLLLRETEYELNRGDWRAGFEVSRWRWLSFNAHYRGQFNQSDYDHLQDVAFGLSDGYSAFIRSREVLSDGVQVSVTLKPAAWMRAVLKYEHDDTRFHVDTDPTTFGGSPGGGIDAGHTLSSRYSGNLIVTPWRRLRCGVGMGYQDSETTTARNGINSVADYAGYSWWGRGTATVVLSDATDVFASYEYWQADYGEGFYATGLPLGAKYFRHALQVGITHRWSDHFSSRLRYALYDYNDAASGGANNYTAHGAFASVSYRWQ